LPNIWKQLPKSLVGLYKFPDADELVIDDAPPHYEVEELPQVPEESEAAPPPEEDNAPAQETEEENPVRYAQVQSDSILKNAEAEARKILERAAQEAEQIREDARQLGFAEGRNDGFQQGMQEARQEGEIAVKKRCDELAAEVEQFISHANAALEQQLDDNLNDLRDLAISIAEKVICVSLKSSTEVIGRMIQTALDKRKKQEWVRIYVSESDARHLTKMNAALTDALSSLSDRVRIIPMSDDEAGACIVELPDEIIDASASTQLNNIRNLLGTTPVKDQDAPFRWRNKSDVQANDPTGE
jgi:flagellar assembly protein FliH